MEKKEQLDLLGVIRVLYKWRRSIIRVGALSVFLTAAISLMLPDYYKATTVFLAASPDQAQPDILFNKSGLRSFVYGTENDIDRMLTISESQELVDFMVDTFDLYDHYRIDSAQKKARHRVQKKFFKYYDVLKTSRDAIELSFEDKDPEFAAAVANAAREKIDLIAQNLLKERQLRAINTFENNITSKNRQLKLLGDSLQVLRKKYNIFNSISQTENITTQYDAVESRLVRNRARLEQLRKVRGIPRDTIVMAEALVLGMEQEVDNLKARIDLLNQGLSRVNTYEKQYLEANQTLSDDQERLKEYQATYRSVIPSTIIVGEAVPPVIKSRPRRSIYVIAAGAIAFLFSVVGVLLIEAYREVNWQEIIHAG